MTDFKQRIISSSVIILFSILCLVLAFLPWFQPIFVAVIAVLSAGALWEFYQIAKSKEIQVPVKIGLTGAVLYTFAVYAAIKWPVLADIPIIVLACTLIILFLNQFSSIKNSLVNLSVTFFGIIYIVVTLACMIKITYFFSIDGEQDGRWWLLYLIAVIKMTDVGGLVFGRLLGKHKLAEAVSPNKTIEGAFGGVIFGLLTSLVFSWLSQNTSLVAINLPYSNALLLGICLSILGEFGDLAESLLKRDGGVKDSNHLPGLGGLLDIVDSLLFATPAMYLYLLITVGR